MNKEYNTLDVALEYLNNNQINTNLEILNEDVVCKDLSNNIYIAITPDINREFEKDPYFKVSNKPINYANANVARISMRTGDYIAHNGASVEIPSKIVGKINELLSEKKGINKKYNDAIDNWDALLLATVTYSQGRTNIEEMRLKFPKIQISPKSSTLIGCKIIKWG